MSRYPSLVTGPKRIVQIFRGRWLLSGVLSVSLVGVWMGYYFGGGADSTGSNQKLRSKLFTLNPNSSSLVHSSKLRGPLRVEIRREEKGENQPIDLDRPFTLVAVISSEMALPSLNLKWS
ncbi:MAG: hypothetical protein KDD35_07110, partial [Bdellovibrionales bacterium]|nr:hypothetical protein [Bdellovibrionales bacterium]